MLNALCDRLEIKALRRLLTERRRDVAGELIVSTCLVSLDVDICHSEVV